MPTPMPTQLTGAEFLSRRKAALLADEPRCGKSGAAIIACDYVLARAVLVITTATNRFNFGRDFRAWQAFPRSVQVLVSKSDTLDGSDVIVCPWSLVTDTAIFRQLAARFYDVVLYDESHYAKSMDAGRCQAVFTPDKGLCARGKYVWCLSGTPIPNAPNDLWPMLYALDVKRLRANEARGWPDVRSPTAFRDRYCTGYMARLGGEMRFVAKGGKNMDELRERLAGFWLRRTQQDVGIQPPVYETLALRGGKIARDDRALLAVYDKHALDIIAAFEAGVPHAADIDLGPLRRITGRIKADLVADFVEEEFDCGLDSVVLMAWHTDTIARMAERLRAHGVVCIEGATTPDARQKAQADFAAGRAKVFIGQIIAAGEAIDLSRSAELIFVEPSFVPKDMSQAALRITNINQTRTPRVRVAMLENSIDEAIASILIRKVASIRQLNGAN